MRQTEKLVESAAYFVGRQRRDYPLNLPPVTEFEHVALVPALLGPDRRLIAGIVPEALDEVMRVVQRGAASDVDPVHALIVSIGSLLLGPTKSVNAPFTTPTLASAARVCQSAGMKTRTPQAGGCLIFLAIVVGIAIGVRSGQLAIGMFAGAAVGIVLAVLVWLVDRWRD